MSRVNGSCDGLSYSTASRGLIPSNDTLVIVTYMQSSNISLQDEPRYEALESCCHPNNASKIDSDCILWCNLPPQYIDDTHGFTECFNRMQSHFNIEQNRTATGGFFQVVNSTSKDKDNGGSTSSTSPSVATMFTLLTLMGSFIAF